MASGLLGTAVLVVLIASLPSVAWFFWMRRVMLRRQAALVRELEERLRPRDKQYWLVGYLVGFAARYRTRDPRAPVVWVTYTTPPYHVFFYLPAIILGRKRERLEVAVEPRSPRLLPGTAYVYKPRIATIALRVRKARAQMREAREAEVRLDGSKYRALYDTPQALELAQRIAQETMDKAPLQMSFVDRGQNTLGFSVALDTADHAWPLVKHALELASRL